MTATRYTIKSFTPADKERELVSTALDVFKFSEIMEALRGWRLAIKREIGGVVTKVTTLDELLVSANTPLLIRIARAGQA